MYNKAFLHNMYNATSTENPKGSDQLETYERWLERQLISRLKTIDKSEKKEKENLEKLKVIRGNLLNAGYPEAGQTLAILNEVLNPKKTKIPKG